MENSRRHRARLRVIKEGGKYLLGALVGTATAGIGIWMSAISQQRSNFEQAKASALNDVYFAALVAAKDQSPSENDYQNSLRRLKFAFFADEKTLAKLVQFENSNKACDGETDTAACQELEVQEYWLQRTVLGAESSPAARVSFEAVARQELQVQDRLRLLPGTRYLYWYPDDYEITTDDLPVVRNGAVPQAFKDRYSLTKYVTLVQFHHPETRMQHGKPVFVTCAASVGVTFRPPALSGQRPAIPTHSLTSYVSRAVSATASVRDCMIEAGDKAVSALYAAPMDSLQPKS